MATMTVSLPDPMKEWIEKQINNGDYASTSDYVRDLVRRDRARRDEQLTMEDLCQLIAESRKSGIGERSFDDIFKQARCTLKVGHLNSET